MSNEIHLANAGVRRPIGSALLAGALGVGAGLVLHVLAIYLRDHGPSGEGWSLRGNGAAVVLVLAVAVLIAGLLWWARRGGWLSALAWTVALVIGLVVVRGGF